MKKILLLFLVTSSMLIAMENKPIMDHEGENLAETVSHERSIESFGLSKGVWTLIIEQLYFNPNILDNANDIFAGIEAIEQYMPICYKTIALVCKAFKDSNISQFRWKQIKDKIKKFYIPYLNQKFLENGKSGEEAEGLYPKNGQWLGDGVAQFLKTGFITTNFFSQLLKTTAGKIPLSDKKALHLKLLREQTNDIKLINLLLFYGININEQNPSIQRPLSIAISHNKEELVKYLLKHEANPNLLDQGKTALHTAIETYKWHKNRNVFNLLMQAGANPNIKDQNGNTALHYALLMHCQQQNNLMSIITFLLKYGANPYVTNNGLKTAFDIAKMSYNSNNLVPLHLSLFKRLVSTYSQNTLQKICLQYVLTNLSRFKDKFVILPFELQDTINKLKS